MAVLKAPCASLAWLFVVFLILPATRRVEGKASFLSPLRLAGSTFAAVALDEPDEAAMTFEAVPLDIIVISEIIPPFPNLTASWVLNRELRKVPFLQRGEYFSQLKEAGAFGTLEVSIIPPQGVLGRTFKLGTRDTKKNYPHHFPIIHITQAENALILNATENGEPVTVLIDDTEENLWLRSRTGFAVGFFQIFIGHMVLTNLALASYKLYKFIKYGKKPFLKSIALAHVCLFLEVVSNLLRFIFVSSEPNWSFSLLGHQGQQIISTLYIPFTASACILICLYWQSLIKTLKRDEVIAKISFLSRFRIPIFVIVGCLITFELVASIFRAFPSIDTSGSGFVWYPILFGILYSLIFISVVAFFLRNGLFVIKMIQSNVKNVVHNPIQSTKLMIAGALASLGLVAGFCILASPYFYTPAGFSTSNLLWTSFLQIIAFNPPSNPKRKSKPKDSQQPATPTNTQGLMSSGNPEKLSTFDLNTPENPSITVGSSTYATDEGTFEKETSTPSTHRDSKSSSFSSS